MDKDVVKWFAIGFIGCAIVFLLVVFGGIAPEPVYEFMQGFDSLKWMVPERES